MLLSGGLTSRILYGRVPARKCLRLLGRFARFVEERASYNGSIEASQASDVGSIPIARSSFRSASR